MNDITVLQNGGVAEIKVGRKHTSLVPFERFYIVPSAKKERMMSFWRYALVMSTSCRNAQTLLSALAKDGKILLEIIRTVLKPQSGKWFLMVPIAVRNQKNTDWYAGFWRQDQRKASDRDKSTQYTSRKNPHKGLLQYLVSHLWSSKRCVTARKNKELSYVDLADDLLLVGAVEGPLGAPCTLCPRHLMHIIGECHFGDIDCYEHLTPTPKEDGDYRQAAEEYEKESKEEIDLGDLGEIVVSNGKEDRVLDPSEFGGA